MPLLDVQQQHATVFRLRFGEKSGNRPARLTDKIRITADNPAVVDAFVARYGGERRAWEGAWEAYLPTNAINVVLIPGQSISQFWELYQGSVCKRRCDSVTEFKSGKPCLCPTRDPDERNKKKGECTATTRVSIMCPDVDVVGAGMFVSHGMMAARSLPTSINVANAALAAGIYVDAVVRIVEFVGDGTRWIVPQIEVVGTSLDELIATARELRAGNAGVLDGSATKILGRPIPPLAELGSGEPRSVREQAEAFDAPPAPRAPRKNAQAPIPPTNTAARTVGDEGLGVIDTDGEEIETDDATGSASPPAAGREGPPADATSAGGPNRVAMWARRAGLDDNGRHDLAEWVSAGRSRSSKDLTDEEADLAIRFCEHVEADDPWVLRRDGDGVIGVIDTRFNFAVAREAVLAPLEDPKADQPDEAPADALTFEEIDALNGPALVNACRARGLPLAGKPGDLRDRLMTYSGLGSEPF